MKCDKCNKEHGENEIHVQGEDGVCASHAKSEETVRASGTSDGAKKGWEKRESWNRSDYEHERTLANEAGTKSEAASEKAEQTKQWQNHHDADSAHEMAAQAHGRAAEVALGIGANSQYQLHLSIAQHHKRMAEYHWQAKRSTMNTNKASDKSILLDVIRCRASSAASNVTKAWRQGEKTSHVWMPAGVSTICAGFRQGSVEMTVKCDEQAAVRAQESLESHRKLKPQQEPYGCWDHHEEQATVRVKADCGYDWSDRGVVLSHYPTKLGADNVNGEIHRGWSPSFTTDADYTKATCGKCDAKANDCACGEASILMFPDGVRGSQSNPAEVTGVDFCVGTLTNKPAFHRMPPVKGSDKTEAKEEPVEKPIDRLFARNQAAFTIGEKVLAREAKPLSTSEKILARMGETAVLAEQ